MNSRRTRMSGAIIITGTGRAFVAGADISRLAVAETGELEKYARFGQGGIPADRAFFEAGNRRRQWFRAGRRLRTRARVPYPHRIDPGEVRSPRGQARPDSRIRRNAAAAPLVGRGVALQLILTGDQIDGTEAARWDSRMRSSKPTHCSPRRARWRRRCSRTRPLRWRTRSSPWTSDSMRRSKTGFASKHASLARSRQRPTCAKERRHFSRSGPPEVPRRLM